LPLGEPAAESLQLITDFETLLKDETIALNTADFDRAEQLQTRKNEMADRYQRLTQELRARRDELKAHHPETRDRLLAARESLAVTARENIDAIERRRFSSQRMVDRLIEGARRGLHKSGGYGKAGQRVSQPVGKVSFGLNQTL